MTNKKRILVAPLNWGLGHATRCIPIINALLNHNFEPIIASDGMALELLRKEFPALTWLKLPSYNIRYPKKGRYIKLKILTDSPKYLSAYKAEKKAIAKINNTYKLDGIISDNRPGVFCKHTPSVFITHQLQVLSGNTTWLSTKMHQKLINQFHECWVPDSGTTPNLSGKLGHTDKIETSIKYIGPLSRFNKIDSPTRYDVMVLLSGPEPQRSVLEQKLLLLFKDFSGRCVFIKGVIEPEQTVDKSGCMTIYNFMTSEILEKTFNESEIILSRSGYTTIMDLTKLNKKAFFIPTPGQFEQEYLAHRLKEKRIAPSCNQDDFKLELLEEVHNYTGLQSFDYEMNFKKLFRFFERK